MLPLTTYLIAFWLGLFSTLHCWGMCGGIIGALSLNLPESVRNNSLSTFKTISAYNLGRISSYTIAGAFAGGFSYLATNTMQIERGHNVLQLFAGTILVLLGLHIAGWLPAFSRIEGYGFKIWRILQPLGKALLPADSFIKATLTGALWGWLPCGLVYAVLLWSLSSGDPLNGALYMLAFGLGTLPSMISAGMAGNLLRNRNLKRTTGIIIICFGLATPLLPLIIPTHHHH